MKLQNNSFLSIEQLQDQYFNQGRKVSAKEMPEKGSFREILQQEAIKSKGGETLKFSKHAAGRLVDRNIELTDVQMERLNDGAKKASEKGIRESLVVVDQLAFIVNIPNNTVITAMDRTETNENVFTNIDGAVIM